MGRPKALDITPELLEQIEQYAAQGLTKKQIASCLGVSYTTLNENQNQYPEFLAAIKRGQASGIEKVSNALFNKAMDGDNVSMIFYLKNRDPMSWEDVQKRELYGKGKNGAIQMEDITDRELDAKIERLTSDKT